MSRQEACEVGSGSLAQFKTEGELKKPEDISKLLEAYNELGLGRPVVLTSKDPITGKPLEELGGYFLPTTNPLEHIVVIKSGELYLVQPKSDSIDDTHGYKNLHNYSPLPYFFEKDSSFKAKGTEELIFYIETGRMLNRVVMTNKNGPSEQLNQKIIEAVDTAFALRDKRLSGMEDSRRVLLDRGVESLDYTPEKLPSTDNSLDLETNITEAVLWDNSASQDICQSD